MVKIYDDPAVNLQRIPQNMWFAFNQELLINIANTKAGRDLLCIPQEYPHIVEIKKDCLVSFDGYESGGHGRFVADFRTAPKFANVIRYRWSAFNAAARYFAGKDLNVSPLVKYAMSVHAATLTAYPDPHPETTTIDGTIFKGNSSNFATTHDAATGEYTTDTSATHAMYWHRTGGGLYYIMRVVSLFDTSSLTASATVSAADFVLKHASSKDVRSNIDSWCVYSSNPASNTALTTSDFLYSNFGTTAFSNSIAFSSMATSGNNDTYSLNASGLAAISLTSITKLAIRTVGDAGNSNTMSSNNSGMIGSYHSADASGTSSDPYLLVTYTLPPPATEMKLNRTPIRGVMRGVMRP